VRYENVGAAHRGGVPRPPQSIYGKAQPVTVKSTIGIVVLVFIVFYVMTSPDQAATIFHNSWDAVVNVAHGIGQFVDKVTS